MVRAVCSTRSETAATSTPRMRLRMGRCTTWAMAPAPTMATRTGGRCTVMALPPTPGETRPAAARGRGGSRGRPPRAGHGPAPADPHAHPARVAGEHPAHLALQPQRGAQGQLQAGHHVEPGGDGVEDVFHEGVVDEV